MHLRLLELLRRLPPSELSGFDKFLESPFFNSNDKALALFRYLMQYAPDFNPPELHTVGDFPPLWGRHKPFDKAALNRLGSQLFKLAEQFLAHSALQADESRHHLYLMRRYEGLGIENHMNAAFRRLEQLKQHPGEGLSRLAAGLEAELILADWMNRSDDRTGEANLQQLNDSLDWFFIAFKLKLLNAMLSRGAVSKTDYRLSWKDAVFEVLEQSAQWRSDPAVELQYRIMQVLSNPTDINHFTALQECMKTHRAALSPADLRDGYACLQNAAKMVFPVRAYFGKLFALYSEQIESGILYENGQLHHGVFRNAVNAALNVNEHEWSARFIAEHREHIYPEAYREAAYLQNMAMLHFHQGNFRQAQDCLVQSNPQDVYYKLADRSLLARIYFEMGESEVLDNFLNAFAKFVFDQQKKIAAPKVRSYRAFINKLRQLHSLINANPGLYRAWSKRLPIRNESDREAVQRLTEEIASEPVFYGQKWLLEKIGALTGA